MATNPNVVSCLWIPTNATLLRGGPSVSGFSSCTLQTARNAPWIPDASAALSALLGMWRRRMETPCRGSRCKVSDPSTVRSTNINKKELASSGERAGMSRCSTANKTTKRYPGYWPGCQRLAARSSEPTVA
ncbi:hypothetical protein EYF80_003524 [Liparis tanakae]|uniref:Uncharacterized protein n=1 Tax=Liparis tanakae TaxID=230148 RepID=A0A4Z2J7W2_9TELE|nr:hypothetical protein EYF80_003524 [Liparis tanakae]